MHEAKPSDKGDKDVEQRGDKNPSNRSLRAIKTPLSIC